MISVCHIVSGDLWAGAESMIYNLLKCQKDNQKILLVVIVCNRGRLAEELRSLGLAVYVVNEQERSFAEIIRETRKIIKEHSPSLIHSHRYKENILAFLSAGFRKRAKLVATLHGLPEFYGKKPSLGQRFKTQANFFALSHFFTTVAVSRDIFKVLVGRFGFHNTQVDVIHNGIDLPSCSLVDNRTVGSFVIGSSGRLVPVKDYPLMVSIAKAIVDKGETGVRFELAGDGPEMAGLREIICRCGLQNTFILKGHQDDMDSFYRGLDLYLNTSVHEGIPMTILEAMSHGLPVVAPAIGGIGEILADGKEGFLLNTRSPGDFAEKCLFIKNNGRERGRMSVAAREKVECEFSTQKMAEKYYSLYCRVMGLA